MQQDLQVVSQVSIEGDSSAETSINRLNYLGHYSFDVETVQALVSLTVMAHGGMPIGGTWTKRALEILHDHRFILARGEHVVLRKMD